MLRLIHLNNMNKKIFLFLPLLVFVFFLTVQAAANPFNIKFPVAELGNCGSMEECRAYCDEPSNLDACLEFGEKQGLIKKEEAQQARKFRETLGEGNGPVAGCRNEEACRRTCSLPENQEVCFKWAKENGFVKEERSSMGVKPQPVKEPEINKERAIRAIETDGGPGQCGSFEACGKFCSDSVNQQTCFEYAKKHQLMGEKELRQAERLVGKSGPGGCHGDACREYCEDPANHEECFKFAKDNGFISEEEVQRIEKFKSNRGSLESFGGPGGCKGEEQCRQYCSEPEHTQECIDFAKKAGFIHEDQAREKLERFQQNIEEYGPTGDFEKYQNGDQENDGQENTEGSGGYYRKESRPEFRHGPPPVIQNGPGGCSSPEECIKFCSNPENKSECAKSGPKSGGPPPGGTFREGEHNENNNYPKPEYSNRPMPKYEEHRPYPSENYQPPKSDYYRENSTQPPEPYQQPQPYQSKQSEPYHQPEQYNQTAPTYQAAPTYQKSEPVQQYPSYQQPTQFQQPQQALPPPSPSGSTTQPAPTSLNTNSFFGALIKLLIR